MPEARMDGTAEEQLRWRVSALRETIEMAAACIDIKAAVAILKNGLEVDNDNATIPPKDCSGTIPRPKDYRFG